MCKSIKEYGDTREEAGRKEGGLLMLANLVKDGLLSITTAAEKAGMSPEEFKKKLLR